MTKFNITTLTSIRSFVIAILISVFVVACSGSNSAQRQVLISELKEADSNKEQLYNTVSGIQEKTSYLEQKLSSQRSSLNEYKGRVEAYMLNHKMAIAVIVAGIGGGSVAIDPNNEFSRQMEEIGGIVAFFAAIYAIDNMPEIVEVADQLAQADRHVKSLESQIKSTFNDLNNTVNQLSNEKRKLLMANQQVNTLRSKLEAII